MHYKFVGVINGHKPHKKSTLATLVGQNRATAHDAMQARALASLLATEGHPPIMEETLRHLFHGGFAGPLNSPRTMGLDALAAQALHDERELAAICAGLDAVNCLKLEAMAKSGAKLVAVLKYARALDDKGSAKAMRAMIGANATARCRARARAKGSILADARKAAALTMAQSTTAPLPLPAPTPATS